MFSKLCFIILQVIKQIFCKLRFKKFAIWLAQTLTMTSAYAKIVTEAKYQVCIRKQMFQFYSASVTIPFVDYYLKKHNSLAELALGISNYVCRSLNSLNHKIGAF